MRLRILPLALAAAVAAGAAAPAAAQTVGIAAAVINDVRMTTDADRALHRAAAKERVSLGNDILTGGASRLQVLLLDKSVFSVGANARLRVDRFVYDPARKSSALGINVARGAFRFMSGKATKGAPGQSRIATPTASIGIRGTIVDGVVGEEAAAIVKEQKNLPDGTVIDPETATIIMLRGPGAGVPGEQPGAIDVTAAGETVALDRPGMAVLIPGPGRPPILFQMWACGAAILANLLQPPADPLDQATNAMPLSTVVGPDGRFALPLGVLPRFVEKPVPPPSQPNPQR